MSKEKLTTEEFLKNDDYAKALSNYAARQGKEFGSREQALENFLSDYRGVQSNTGLAVLFANRASLPTATLFAPVVLAPAAL